MPHLLLILLFVPLVGAGLSLAFAEQGIDQVRKTALVNVLVSLALSVLMVVLYDPAPKDGQLVQMVSSYHWLNAFGTSGGPDVRLSLGVDGLSLWLIALTAVLMVPSVLVSWEAVTDRPGTYYAHMLFLQAGLVGVFAAQDIILFYIFFEFTLIPLFFMIGQWGGHDRRWAARKFFIYTFAGSASTFLGLLFLVLANSWLSETGTLTFNIAELTNSLAIQVAKPENREWWRTVAPWVFLALFAGFAIKVPLFPFHTWLPLAHVEAPTAGSVLLAGVLLKIGSYGFLRFALPIVPEGVFTDYNLLAIPSAIVAWITGGPGLPEVTINGFDLIAWLSVIGIIYGALLALAQDDIKKLVAYSSVSHMGFCILGLFALNPVGITGGLLQMINHGLSTGALFAIVGMLYERYHTRDIEAYGGMARKFPVLCFCLMVVAFSSIGLPGLNGFTGEVLALMGMFRESRIYAILALSGIILGAWYMLSLVRRTFFGRFHEPIIEGHHGHDAHPARDMNAREMFALAPLLVLIVAIGLFPQFFIRRMEPSILQVSQTLATRQRLFRAPVAQQPQKQSARQIAAKP